MTLSLREVRALKAEARREAARLDRSRRKRALLREWLGKAQAPAKRETLERDLGRLEKRIVQGERALTARIREAADFGLGGSRPSAEPPEAISACFD